MKLSLLICSINKRKKMLERLLNVLEKQKTDEVEILTNIDDGKKKIGTKRNELLEMAKGDYVAFIDDDDLVFDKYIKLILQALEEEPDCVGFKGKLTRDGSHVGIFTHSIKYKKWFQKGKEYYRCPNHLNPIRKDLALKVKFPNKNWGEDRDYSVGLRSYLKKEVFIDQILYYYLFISKGKNKGFKRVPVKRRRIIKKKESINRKERIKNKVDEIKQNETSPKSTGTKTKRKIKPHERVIKRKFIKKER